MVNKTAIVLGALGQDGSFMCEVLIENGYNVYGIIKPETDESRLVNKDVIYLRDGISTMDEIVCLISKTKPSHIYNFMGVSDVFDPWMKADITYELNFMIPMRFIEAIKNINKEIKFLQASSCLVYGLTKTKIQTELNERIPIYHYGISKNFTDEIINKYREMFDMYLCSAVFYNHESERRNENFFTKKLIKGAIDVVKGKKEYIELGDLNGLRDIGYAKDYMQACLLIMEQEKSDNYNIGTGISTSMLDIVKIVFDKLNLSLEKNLITKDALKRGVDLSHLVADNSKIKKIGWAPNKSINDIIDIMINYEMKKHE